MPLPPKRMGADIDLAESVRRMYQAFFPPGGCSERKGLWMEGYAQKRRINMCAPFFILPPDLLAVSFSRRDGFGRRLTQGAECASRRAVNFKN
jgi:hypothetical protein